MEHDLLAKEKRRHKHGKRGEQNSKYINVLEFRKLTRQVVTDKSDPRKWYHKLAVLGKVRTKYTIEP